MALPDPMDPTDATDATDSMEPTASTVIKAALDPEVTMDDLVTLGLPDPLDPLEPTATTVLLVLVDVMANLATRARSVMLASPDLTVPMELKAAQALKALLALTDAMAVLELLDPRV